MQEIIFYCWKNKKIPKVPTSAILVHPTPACQEETLNTAGKVFFSIKKKTVEEADWQEQLIS